MLSALSVATWSDPPAALPHTARAVIDAKLLNWVLAATGARRGLGQDGAPPVRPTKVPVGNVMLSRAVQICALCHAGGHNNQLGAGLRLFGLDAALRFIVKGGLDLELPVRNPFQAIGAGFWNQLRPGVDRGTGDPQRAGDFGLIIVVERENGGFPHAPTVCHDLQFCQS